MNAVMVFESRGSRPLSCVKNPPCGVNQAVEDRDVLPLETVTGVAL